MKINRSEKQAENKRERGREREREKREEKRQTVSSALNREKRDLFNDDYFLCKRLVASHRSHLLSRIEKKRVVRVSRLA